MPTKMVFTGLILMSLLSACSPAEKVESEPVGQSGVEVVAAQLRVPWEVAFMPDGDILVTERPGTIARIDQTGQIRRIPVSNIRIGGEGGLLGMALHPDFTENNWLYLYFTTTTDAGIENRVMRYTFKDDSLAEPREIITNLPGSANHNGGRIAFGPDGFLYITTGDAQVSEEAQDPKILAGKILRIHDDGFIPPDNPFGSAVYSYGHRNPQGLTWDSSGQLWSTEHGRSGLQTGMDELNRIEKGKNYGWPVIEGEETEQNMVTPILQSGADDTWAPAALQYVNGSFFFGGLRGNALYQATESDQKMLLQTHLWQKYGRIRAVTLGPDGLLYITTSNRDGRGTPSEQDDLLLRVDPKKL